MTDTIYIFGHSDKEFKAGWEDIEQWLQEELVEEGRYRYIQKRNADVILLSFEGFVKAELKVVSQVEPTPEEKEYYEQEYGRIPATVYIISEIQIYENPVRAVDFGVKQYQFGKVIEQDTYEKMRSYAGIISTLKVGEGTIPKEMQKTEDKKPKILENLPSPTSTWNEEDVKIKIAVPLLESLGYSRNEMKLEVPIKFGSTTHKADIVVKDLLCEVKSPRTDLSKALRQAIDYSLKLPEIKLILVTNGRQFKWRKKQNGDWIKYTLK